VGTHLGQFLGDSGDRRLARDGGVVALTFGHGDSLCGGPLTSRSSKMEVWRLPEARCGFG
jgi:hypothetical protein